MPKKYVFDKTQRYKYILKNRPSFILYKSDLEFFK